MPREELTCDMMLNLAPRGSARRAGNGLIAGAIVLLLVTGSIIAPASRGQEITPHEYSPGVTPQPYDYFHPVRSGALKVMIAPTDVWDQVTPAAVAGCNRHGLLPVAPGAEEPDEYGGQILEDLGRRHFLEVVLFGDPGSINSGLIQWFWQHGAASVTTVLGEDLFSRSAALAEREIPEPRCVVITTFNLLAAHLAAVASGPAFASRHETSLPSPYKGYIERHRQSIEKVYLVDVGQAASPSQTVYHTYGSLTVPAPIEQAIASMGIPVVRITGEYEEDVSVAVAREIESVYASGVAQGLYRHLPMGWIPSSSLVSEWTNLGALIPFAVAKQWFIMEYWADIHLEGRQDTVNAFSDRYVEDFFLGLACLRHARAGQRAADSEGQGEYPAAAALRSATGGPSCASCASSPEPSRRDRVICTFYRWLADYLFRTGIRDFILCESNGPYGENAAPIFNFEQVPGMILSSQMKGLYYRGWSGGGGLSGIDYDGARAARKSCAVTLLAFERALYPPLPWDGEVDDAWPPPAIDHWEEAPRAVCITSDYEGWYANVFLTPRLIEFGQRKGVKFTLRPQGDISVCLPDYLRRYFLQGRGVIEFSNQGFLHEFNLLPYFSPYDHARIVTDAVDRMRRYAGIMMAGFMPAGGFLTSPDLVGPARSLGLRYVLCPQGKYAPVFDQYFDVYSRLKAPQTHVSVVSHFSERLGDLASGTVEEDIAGNIDFVETMVRNYDEPPYAPYTAWHFAHGFQMPDEDAFRVLEATVDYLDERYVRTGEMVFATLADVAAFFEEGRPLFRTPVAASGAEAPPSNPPGPADGEGCGGCSHLSPGSGLSAGANYLGESCLLTALLCVFFGLERARSANRTLRARRPSNHRALKEPVSVSRHDASALCGFALFLCVVCGLAVGGVEGCGSEEEPSPAPSPPVRFTVMTYNILFDVPDPGFDRWAVRKDFVAEIIHAHDPDVVGLQEPFAYQVEDLLELCPGYQAIALVNPPGPLTDTDATILFREGRFAKIVQGSYWLSPTPDVPFSGGFGKGFGNFFPRMVIWAYLVDLESHVQFYVVNTHFDNTSPSQEKSAPLFLERTEPLARKAPVIVTGDFNSRPSSTAYRILTSGSPEGQEAEGGADGTRFSLTDSFDLAAQGYEVRARQGDPIEYDPESRIDHVFVAGGEFSCRRWVVDMTRYGPELRYPSDHFAVVAHLELGPASP